MSPLTTSGRSWAFLMPDGSILDNDVLIKACCYSVTAETMEVLAPFGAVSVLGVARFATPKQVRKSSRIADKVAAESLLRQMLAAVGTVEPTSVEIGFAATLEQLALERGLPLDGGEGQILAVIVHRTDTMMITGDKRAIASVPAVLEAAGIAGTCDGRVACLEQLLSAVLLRTGHVELRRRVCAEREVDKAMTSVFSCHGMAEVREEDVLEGLASYVGHLRASTDPLLHPGMALSVVPEEDRVR